MQRGDRWPDLLRPTLDGCTIFREVVVLAETASTQTLAKERADEIGLVVTTLRQTAGRGRLGRVWADTAEDGLAVTFVAPDRPNEELAVASAVAAARAVERFLPFPVGIKWPNDLVVAGKKLAGILIERAKGAALIGIGINVSQRQFPDELKTATSVALLGGHADRFHMLAALVAECDRAIAGDGSMIEEYAARDALRGTVATFDVSGPNGLETVIGEVLQVDPCRGLVVRTATGDRELPAATTSVRSWTVRAAR